MTGPDRQAEASGERFVPELMGGELIEAEHQARYRLALPFVAGKRVLDAGCGTGWGSELMVQAGAREVIGIDIADEAVGGSRKRVGEATFLQGDLQDLPFRSGSFDVVICFEALEHTLEPGRTLDNLAAVLADDGLLFVSSPNPGVYPGGNPFHFHEMAPDELRDAVATRLGEVVLLRQHLHLASTICEDEAGRGAFRCPTYPVRPMGPGREPYSVVVASRRPLPPVGPAQALSPSEQLQRLDTLGAALAEERSALSEDHARIVAERERLLDEVAESHRRLVAAGEDLAGLMAERDSAVSQVRDAMARIDRLGQERDRFAVALVRAEQQLAAVWQPPARSEEARVDDSQLQARLDELMAHAGRLEQELTAMHATVSWRITRPLRQLQSRIRSRRGG